jgi:uroporphyrinogen-III decarboxylase
MSADMEPLYQQRLNRYVTAMRNEKPDMVPIRPFVAEFTGVYAGYTCQEVAHDYEKAFDAACKCAADFDWDAAVANMVYVWTGLTQVIDLVYYGVPGIDIPPDTAFQYREPPPEKAFMRPEEYDQLIEDPTGYMYNVWLPRVASSVQPVGEPTTLENNLSFLKGGMAMLQYFGALGGQVERLRRESGTVSAICGMIKAPLDILADKFRGYLGLVDDLFERPKKVMAACEALMPHLYHVATTTADPAKQVPIGYWMHRGCVPFISFDQFKQFYWPTVKPIIQQLWADGHQTLFYAEGNWDHHLDSFAELPDLSIVYHVDMGDIFKVHEVLGEKFCISGGIPNVMLACRPPDEVREYSKKVIEGVGRDGGYIIDAGAIMQNDTRVENLKAMTEAARRYGVYPDGKSSVPSEVGTTLSQRDLPKQRFMPPLADGAPRPGVCVPWEKKRSQLPEVRGNPKLVQDVWESIDALAYTYIWQILLSF